MDIFAQVTLNGIALGCVYSLVALGFVLIYKATEVINFAQGELMMVGAYIYFSLVTAGGLAPLWAFGVTLVVAGVLGALIERAVLHPLMDEPVFTQVMATIGLAAVLRAITGLIWSHDTHAFPSPVPAGAFKLGELSVSWVDAWSVLLTLGLCGLLFVFFRFTRLGIALRAVAQNRYAAYLMGIRVERMFALTWALAAAVGAVGGILLADISYLHTNMGFIGLRAFPAVILGGLESIPGALLGGLIIGLVESFAGLYLDPLLGSGTREIAAFVVLLAVLLVRPTGLFGEPDEKRV